MYLLFLFMKTNGFIKKKYFAGTTSAVCFYITRYFYSIAINVITTFRPLIQ